MSKERSRVNEFNAFLTSVTGEIDGFMYTYILVFLLVVVGVYFTCLLYTSRCV